jgi:poly(A) polymerase/tRNA nucleotidyltransferase (CCA-adding enzyme)
MTQVWDALPEARVVGGAVRDTLARRPVADVDFAVPLEPDVVMARLRAAGLGVVPTGMAHGTVTAVAGGVGFEVTSLRQDVATDGRRAVVAFTDDWEMDASRRDFTINAMSMARDGTTFDYFGGRADLAAGRVRFVGEAAARIAEDYLRIFRFFRFFARYGRGEPDRQALAAIERLRDGVRRLSVERVWSELKGILVADDPRAAVGWMDRTGILRMVVPAADVGRLDAVVAHGPVDVLLRVAALLRSDAAVFGERWKLSGAEQERLVALASPNRLTPEAGEDEIRRALAETPADVLVGRTWLAQDDGPGWARLRERIGGMERPVFPLRGRDVTEAGLAPGPEVGEVLREVYGWWLEGGCVADGEDCRTQLVACVAKRRGWPLSRP